MAKIEYFYAAHSAFAYLGSARFMQIAKAAGCKIVHKPYDLRRAVAEVSSPFAKRSKAHFAYYFGREIERWSEQRGAPIAKVSPTHHANDITLPNCVLIAALERGIDIDALAHAMLECHWRDDVDLADAPTLAKIAQGVGLDPKPLLADALTPAIRARYEANTAEAIRRSVFGSPTYFIDGDMFYGQDRLEMVERALKRPYAGSTPRPDFTCAVSFDAETPCIVMHWRGYATKAQFRAGNERVLEAIRTHRSDRLLGDIVDFVLIGAEDQRWLNDNWIPRAIEAGLRRVALVQPSFYFNRVAVESVMEKLDPAKLDVGYFSELAAARSWLGA